MDTKGIFRCWPSSFKTTICLQKNLEKCKQVILEKPQKITLTPKSSAKSVTRMAFSNRFPCGWPFCMGHANEPAICIIITSMIIIIYTYLGRGNSEAPNRTDKIENLRSSICHVQVPWELETKFNKSESSWNRDDSRNLLRFYTFHYPWVGRNQDSQLI